MNSLTSLLILSSAFLVVIPFLAVRDFLLTRAMARGRARPPAMPFQSEVPSPSTQFLVLRRFSDWVSSPGHFVRVRAEDSLWEKFSLDAQDLQDIVIDLLRITDRSFHRLQENPYYGKIRTLADLTYFIESQPRAHRLPGDHTLAG